MNPVENFLESITSQLNAQIDEAIEYYGYAPSIQETLEKPDWYDLAPFDDMEFQYEHAKFTFLQIFNVFEMLHGYGESDFVEAVRKSLIKIVAQRMELYLDKVKEDEQEEYVYELNQAIREAV